MLIYFAKSLYIKVHGCVAVSAGKPLDDKHLLPEVSTLFMAGFESESLHPCHCMFLGYHSSDASPPGHGVLHLPHRQSHSKNCLHEEGLWCSETGLCQLRLPCSAATGHTAAWVVYAVSQHPEVEAKIVEELRSLDLLATPEQPTPRPIQWDDIPHLTYLNAVIKVPSIAPQSRQSALPCHLGHQHRCTSPCYGTSFTVITPSVRTGPSAQAALQLDVKC